MADLMNIHRHRQQPQVAGSSGQSRVLMRGASIKDGQRSAAQPVAFGLCAGRYMAAAPFSAASSAAVLFAAPWGLEELSTRRFFRSVAEELSERGFASLRFDYPGTGDSLDPDDFGQGLGLWRKSLEDAAAYLRGLGHSQIIVVGLGLGASLAFQVCAQIDGLHALAIMAPVLSGRAYTRELAVWSKVVDDSLNLKPEYRAPAGATAIASLVMPAEVAADLARLRLAQCDAAPAVPVLLLERPGQMGADDFAAVLEKSEAPLVREAFEGYDALIAGPLTARMPVEAVAKLVRWVEHVGTPVSAPALDPSLSPGPMLAALNGRGFRETGVRFGDSDRLAGVLCEPAGPSRGPAVLFFGSAFDRHSGWGRLTTVVARRLAEQGYASLRFDCADVGDSPPVKGGPVQVLYAPSQLDDADAALTFLQSRHKGTIVGVGRCSGAYLAFRSGIEDERLSGLVLINPYAFVWDESRPLNEDLRAIPQSLGTYWRKMINPRTFARVIKGEMNLRQSVKNLGMTIAGKLDGVLLARTGMSLLRRSEREQVLQSFAPYAKRRVPIRLLYSRGDVGIDHLEYHFEKDGRKLAAYDNVSVTFLPDTDHNLTPGPGRAILMAQLLDLLRTPAAV